MLLFGVNMQRNLWTGRPWQKPVSYPFLKHTFIHGCHMAVLPMMAHSGTYGNVTATNTHHVCSVFFSMSEIVRDLTTNGQTGSCPDSHLQVEAGQTDCVIFLLFAFSFLQQRKNTNMLLSHPIWKYFHVFVIHVEELINLRDWSPTGSQAWERWRSFLSAVEVYRKGDKKQRSSTMTTGSHQH